MRDIKGSMLTGLIGYPVAHTLSPIMHNAAFRAAGVDGVYSAFEVPPAGLRSFVRDMAEFGMRGFNVTIPHKERIVPCMDRLDAEAKLIGAVNTVVVRKGRVVGYNTDGRGFVQSVEHDLGLRPSGKRFFVLGAGGAARAIGFSLALRRAGRIVFVDVDRRKAAGLARAISEKTSCEAIALERNKGVMREFLLNTDLLINATPCGLQKGDPRVIEPDLLHRRLMVYDVIYNPAVTKVLSDAKKRGIRCANGLGMLIDQGALSFTLWTGRRAPVSAMRRALQQHLKG